MENYAEAGAAFAPGKIGTLSLKNRLIVPAMVANNSQEDGKPSERSIRYYEEKAKGGWGMLITEDYAVTPTAGGFRTLSGLWEDGQIEAHTKFVDRIHKLDTKICCQIYHAGRQTNSKVNGAQCLAPSPYKDPPSFETPKEMTKEDIETVIQAYADAAVRAKKCGFDAVEIHGAHGYLINQFSSPFSNKRSDEYGGTTENRARFGVEVIRRVRQAVGKDFPVLFKLTTNEFVAGGLEIAEGRELARIFAREEIDAITISQGVNATEWGVIPPAAIPPAGFIAHVKACRDVVKNIPVIAIGRILNIDLANHIIEDGTADFVCMGRASIADPLAPKKYLEGDKEDIQLCIGCVQGCLGNLRRGEPIQCLVNPKTNKEYLAEETEVKTEQSKNITVVGAGISGCEVAITAAKKGHKVTVYEKSNQIGGQWLLAAVPPSKQDFTTLVTWQKRQMELLGIEVKLNTEYSPALAKQEKPDLIVVATGSKEKMLPLKGLDGEHVYKAQEILSGKKTLSGKNVVVLGGGSVGVETAAHVAQDFKKVSILEVRDDIAIDGEFSNNYFLFKILDEFKVQVHTKAFYQNYENGTVTYKYKDKEYEIDDVSDIIVAVGSASNQELVEELKATGIETIMLGDAKEVKQGIRNLEEAYYLGWSL
ncbi:MAG: FAD-dependent oxidoreductase [Lachnospiraceae bacterium]|nr:FAD-dependent oxidoreductase [Lachnospiraceae bacterium]MDD3617329.1 FAD-dependent oxidoreductase [Lachnospiraceae bacterium]